MTRQLSPPRAIVRLLPLAGWLAVLLLTAGAFRAVLEFQFVGDARFLIPENLLMRDLGSAWGQVTHNYFWSSSGNLIPYWRPLTKLSWLLEYQAFGQKAAGYMVVQVAWHLLGVLGVMLLGRETGLSWLLSGLAGLIYGLHPVAVAPVCLLMARSDAVAAAATVWAVLCFLRWRRDGGGPWRAAAWLTVHLLALVLALGSKETVVGIPLLLGAWSLLAPPRPGPDPGRAPSTVVSRGRGLLRGLLTAVPGLLLVGTYLLLRKMVLRAEAAGLEEVSVAPDPLRIFAGLSMYLQNLWPLLLQSGVRDISPVEAGSAWFVARGVMALGAAVAVLALALRRRDMTAVCLLLWIGLALGPVLITGNIHVPGADLKYSMADRWLVHALAPAALLWTRLLQPLQGRRWGVAAAAMAAVWAGLILQGSSPAALEFGSEAGLLENEDRVYFRSVPERFRTRDDHCRHGERAVVRALMRGDSRSAGEQARELEQRCGATPERTYWHFSSLVEQRRYAEAAPLARRLMERPPADRRGHGQLCRQLGLTILHTGKPKDAERWLAQSLRLGAGSCSTLVLLAEAARADGRPADAAPRLLRAFACGGRKDLSLPLAASTLLLQGGKRAEAAALLRQIRAGFSLDPAQRAHADALQRSLDNPDIPSPELPGAAGVR